MLVNIQHEINLIKFISNTKYCFQNSQSDITHQFDIQLSAPGQESPTIPESAEINSLTPSHPSSSTASANLNGDMQQLNPSETPKNYIDTVGLQNSAVNIKLINYLKFCLFCQGLKKYIEQSSEGKIILSGYEQEKNRLTKTLRSRLCRLVIRREKDRVLQQHPPNTKLQSFV